VRDAFGDDFDAIFAEFARRVRPGRFEPNTDVALTDDGEAVIVTVEIAGAEPTELRVMMEGRTLYILGRRTDRDRDGRGSYLMKEIDYGEFAKKIHLPLPASYETATAVYRDGMLTIRLPLSKDALVTRNRTEIRMTVKRIPV
jgi:HSP20 family protein